jgi:hypothetical protein
MNENFEQNRIEVEQSDIDVCLSEIKQLFFKTNEFLSPLFASLFSFKFEKLHQT